MTTNLLIFFTFMLLNEVNGLFSSHHLYSLRGRSVQKSFVELDALGSIALVGAGPGDPELLTLQAVRLLKNASLVISDRLVSPEILQLVTCKLLIARKLPGCAEEAQDEIYEWAKEAVLRGENVVRLKIGDPYLFGRGGEEVLEFRKLGLEPLVAAGVSSSYSAPLSSGIPLTHRGVANQVLITTGYGRDSTKVDLPPFSSDRTVVLLMAVGRLAEIVQNMTQSGYPSNTPIAIIERATTPQQRTIYGTLATIVGIADREQPKAPATIIVGEVVSVLNPLLEEVSLPTQQVNDYETAFTVPDATSLSQTTSLRYEQVYNDVRNLTRIN